MKTEKELSDLQAGDKVVVHSGGFVGGKYIATINRLTSSQMILSDNGRFNRTTGNMVGASSVYTSSWVSVPKAGEVETIRSENRRRKLISKFGDRNTWNGVKLETLEAIDAIISPNPNEP